MIGYGKMGREIEKILKEGGHRVSVVIDDANRDEFTAARFRGIDVAFEFSTPETAYDNIAGCFQFHVPVVCGTTGWLDRFDDAVDLCVEKDGAFFYASNYSVGVNIFFRLNETLAKIMNRFPAYDVTIEEVHHTQKKDAPSGTAVTLAEGIARLSGRKKRWVGNTSTNPDELEVLSVRRSTVPGIHTVTWESEADLITLEHSAKNRSGLAMGAVLAAEFLQGKKGVYSMSDLLNL